MKHSIDHEKVKEKLIELGWKKNQYGRWEYPQGISTQVASEQWERAILAGVKCEEER